MSVEKYKFIREPGQEYFCPVSLEVLLNPRRTDCCSNHISSTVAEKLAVGNKPCPICNTPSHTQPDRSDEGAPVFTTQSDPAFQESVLNLKVLCTYNGCKWVGPLRDVNDHSLSCGLRPWTCQHCMFKTTYDVGMSEHAQKCLERSVQSLEPSTLAPNSGNVEMSMSDLLPCEFADAGCRSLIHRNDYSDHVKENLSHHHLLISQWNLKLRRELVEKDAEIVRLQMKVSRLLGSQTNRDETVNKEGAGIRDGTVKYKEGAGSNRDKTVNKEGAGIRDGTVKYKEGAGSNRDETVNKEGAGIRDETVNKEGAGSNRDGTVKYKEGAGSNRDNEMVKYGSLYGHSNEQKDAIMEPNESLANAIKVPNGAKNGPNGATNRPNGATNRLIGGTDGVTNIPTRVNMHRNNSDAHFPRTGPAAARSEGNYRYFRGLQERVLIRGLNQAWGLAIAGNVLFVVDTKGGVVRHTVLDGSTDAVVPGIKLQAPKGLALDRDGNMIIVDSGASQILKFTPDGTVLAASESRRGSNIGEFNGPIGVAVDATGRVFVCDRLNHRIQILNQNLEVQNMFGEKGTGPLHFTNPWDVAFDSQGNVYVADCGNRCVKVFTPMMNILRVVGKGQSKFKDGDLRAPTSVCLDRNDNLYVTDRGLSSVVVYDKIGQYILTFGKFMEPNAVHVDALGRVYISENGDKAVLFGELFKLKGSGRVVVYA